MQVEIAATENAPSSPRRARLRLIAAVLWLILPCPVVVGAEDTGSLARLAALLEVPATPTSCQQLPPTPSPNGDAEPLTQCITEADGVQYVTLRTDDGRLVWLDYTGPWQRGPAGPAQWNAMLKGLQRAFGAASGPRAHCRLWPRDDGVVRAALQGSSDGDDGVVRLLRMSVSGAESQNALGC